MRSRGCTFASIGALSLSLIAAADDAPPTPTDEPRAAQPTTTDESAAETTGAAPSESIAGDLDESARGSHAGLLPEGPVTFLYGAWKTWADWLDDATGLRLGFAFTALYQHAFASQGFRDAAGFDIDLYGKWRLLGAKEGTNNGYLNFYGEYRDELFAPVPARLGPEVGSAWNTSDGFNSQSPALTQFYWEQHLFDDAFVANVGKIKADNYYSTNRASNDNLLFLNRAFSSNPAMKYPGAGLGLNLKFQTDLWYVTGGFQDAQGKKTTSGFDTFGDGDYFYAGEFGLTPTIEGLGKGNYRFTYWYSDDVEATGTPASQGFSLSCDQEISPDTWGVFMRYGYSDGWSSGIEQLVGGGVVARVIPCRADDLVGIGLSWGEPASGARDQWTSELFYRVQLGTREQLTLGMQFITDPSNFPDQDHVEIFEARFRIAF